MSLLDDILTDSAQLDPRRGERGMVEGRRTSAPLSRRAPADLDVLVLTDPRTGVLAVLMHWAGRIRWEKKMASPPQRSRLTESTTIRRYWDWSMRQPWGGEMFDQLAALAGQLHEYRYGTPVRPCPVCGEPVRLDRFVTEHRECLDVSLDL